jgi:hypothetical protein
MTPKSHQTLLTQLSGFKSPKLKVSYHNLLLRMADRTDKERKLFNKLEKRTGLC